MLLVARMMRILPRVLSLMRQDCIRFEDALGRIQNLQYQHFRNWQVFQAMVHCTFEDVPGIRKILRGKYTLTSPRLPGQQLTAERWDQQVYPGMTVIMVINVRARAIYDAGCPNCLTSNTSSCSATTSRCHSCGRVFSRSFDTNIIPTYGDPHSIQALGYPHGAGRTPRKIAGRYELELLKKWLERSRSQSSEDGDRQLKDTFDDDLAKSDSDTVSSNDTTTNADQGSSDSERRK